MQSENPSIRQVALYWTLEALIKEKIVPIFIQKEIFGLLRPFKMPWLVFPILEWLTDEKNYIKNDILNWLVELDYKTPEERMSAIEPLLNNYLSTPSTDLAIMETLKHLDTLSNGEVTDLLLYHFPAKTEERNNRIINLLGQTKRYRIIKPIITFSMEFPNYRRQVIKALSNFESEETDQFLLYCLDRSSKASPMVLMEAIRQARKRRLKKAIPLLDILFPIEEDSNPLINESLNGEIALSMAFFGAYCWGREKLLPKIMLGGITQKYLKAIDMLNLTEAVPLLKAIILMPETPEITAIQHYAYNICERLLLQQRACQVD